MHKRTAWLVGVGVGLIVFGPGLLAHLRLGWQRYQLDRSLRNLETTKQQLLDERERLTSDPVYVEGLIRSTFKVAKPGELVIPKDTFNENQDGRR